MTIESKSLWIRIESRILADLKEQAAEREMPMSAYVGYLLTAVEIGAVLNDGTPKSASKRVDWDRLRDHFGVPLGQPLLTL
jgi:hypothetical protein